MRLFSSSLEPPIPDVDSLSLEAFMHCPNRAMELQISRKITYDFTCPKYPDGTEVSVNLTDKTSVAKVADQLGCSGCPYRNDPIDDRDTSLQIDVLHPDVYEMASSLFATEHYPEAVLNGWQTVRAELRARTGHERASDAFGNGGLDIASDAPEHLREDVEQGAKFLMMAIDRFRNVSAHSPGGMNALFPEDPASQLTVEFLSVASLAMRLLNRNHHTQSNDSGD